MGPELTSHKGSNVVPKPTVQHIYIYIYAVKLLSGPSLASLSDIIWAKFALLKTLSVKEHYKNRGFGTFLFEKRCAHKF